MITLVYPYYFQKLLSSFPLHILPSSSFPPHPLHLFIFNFRHRKLWHKQWLGITSNCHCSFVKHKYLHLHCLLHLFIFFISSIYYITKHLLTIGALDMMWCRPENINIDLDCRHHIMSNAPIVNNCILSFHGVVVVCNAFECLIWALRYFLNLGWIGFIYGLMIYIGQTVFSVSSPPPNLAWRSRSRTWKFTVF